LLPLIDGSPKLKKAPVGSPGRLLWICNDTQRSAVASVNAVGSAAEIRRLSQKRRCCADGWLAEAVELLPGLLKEDVVVPAICVNVNGEAFVVGMVAKARRKNSPHVL